MPHCTKILPATGKQQQRKDYPPHQENFFFVCQQPVTDGQTLKGFTNFNHSIVTIVNAIRRYIP